MDIVYITALRAETIIGIHDWEREERQAVIIDLELGCDTTRAARSDDISYALDYAKVSEQVIALVEASQCLLVETLAEKIARLLTRDYGVPWLRLRLSKPAALEEAGDVGVIIERDRRSR
ncbi:MAG: dihydroneopterin aldolase [Halioglobus sp.]|nr:dihydroneopterin aldolase [Halioglobus sp.]